MQIVSPATSLYFAGKEMEIKYEAAVASPANTPVRINIHLMLWGGGVEIKRSLPPINYSGTYNATFDINQVLYAELFKLSQTQVFAFPGDPDQPILGRKDLMMLEYWIDVSYNYIDDDGETQEEGRTDNSAQKYWTMQGGIGRKLRYHLQKEGVDFLAWLNQNDTNLKFLSWIPNNMPIHPTQPVRLWFYNDSKLDQLNLKLEATFTDGTKSGVLSRGTVDESNGLFELACGALEMRLPVIDITKTVASYKIWLQNSDGTVKTETKTFVIDYNIYERNDILFFRTSLGVNEVLWCHGRRKDKLKTSTEERTQPLASNALGSGTIRAYRSELNYSWEMNTGWFPKSMLHYLADFISAAEAKLPVKFFYMPVTIKAGSYKWGEDGKDMFSLPFKINEAYQEQYFSPVPDVDSPWGDFNDDFNEDFF